MALDYCAEQQTTKTVCEEIPKCGWCGPNATYVENSSFCYTNTPDIACCPAYYEKGNSPLCNLTLGQKCTYYQTGNDQLFHALCCQEKTNACGASYSAGVCCADICCYDATQSFSTCCLPHQSCCPTSYSLPLCCDPGTHCCPGGNSPSCCANDEVCCGGGTTSWCCPVGKCGTSHASCLPEE